MPKISLSHFEVAILFALFTSVVLGITTVREGVWQAKIDRIANRQDYLRYGAKCFGYFLLALFGIGWVMWLGHR